MAKLRQRKRKGNLQQTPAPAEDVPPKGGRRYWLMGAVAMVVLAAIAFLTRTPAIDDTFSQSSTHSGRNTTVFHSFELLETVPHDSKAFTQGLLTIKHDEEYYLLEGTGMHGKSELRTLRLNGNIVHKTKLPDAYFGEGIVHYKKDGQLRLLQLTWQERTVFEYEIVSPSEYIATRNFTFTSTKNEGWGITYDPHQNVFYVSDGSDVLHVWDDEFTELRRISVYYQFNDGARRPLHRLNELEYDPTTNTILANIWGENYIARINANGLATHFYNLTDLYRPRRADVLNGIALTYDLLQENGASDELWVTGKYWTSMYRIRLL